MLGQTIKCQLYKIISSTSRFIIFCIKNNEMAFFFANNSIPIDLKFVKAIVIKNTKQLIANNISAKNKLIAWDMYNKLIIGICNRNFLGS